MVAFNRGFGFTPQRQIGRTLINPKNSALRPGNLPVMPRTEVGRLTGESPKTGGVEDKPNTNDKLRYKPRVFKDEQELFNAARNGKIKDGEYAVVPTAVDDGNGGTVIVYREYVIDGKPSPTGLDFVDSEGRELYQPE